MREQPYVPTTEEVRDEYAKGGGEYRDIAEGWFDRWLDRERAVARREGQVEALRVAANTEDPDHDTEVALGGSDYVRVWLHARADRIENGEGRHVDQ